MMHANACWFWKNYNVRWVMFYFIHFWDKHRTSPLGKNYKSQVVLIFLLILVVLVTRTTSIMVGTTSTWTSKLPRWKEQKEDQDTTPTLQKVNHCKSCRLRPLGSPRENRARTSCFMFYSVWKSHQILFKIIVFWGVGRVVVGSCRLYGRRRYL